MNQRGKSFLTWLGLFLSACLAIAGLVGFIIVVKMGLMPSGNSMGHSKEYEQGWSLFFLLFLGLPCLAAFLGGLAPWIVWLLNSRRNKNSSSGGES
jgi:hypothetical protein